MVVNAFSPTFSLLYLLLDGLPIFTRPRRCVHNYLAGTIVINVPPEVSDQPSV
jgi:hypothetical protein